MCWRKRLRSRGDDEEIPPAGWTPLVDIYETADELVLKVELSEIDRRDVQIEINNSVLCISGERKMPVETQKSRHHNMERWYGRFNRRFTLPGNVDQENVRASFADGVLSIRLTRKAADETCQIRID